MPSRSALLDRRTQLASEVAAHKAAIRLNRQQLQEKAAALATIDAECRRLGIKFVYKPRSLGAGDIHGHHPHRPQEEDRDIHRS